VALEVAVSAASEGVARVSARSLSVEVGVSKDTAARALRRLAAAADGGGSMAVVTAVGSPSVGIDFTWHPTC
jgi:hypothetical protein